MTNALSPKEQRGSGCEVVSRSAVVVLRPSHISILAIGIITFQANFCILF
jgi:hypothetical protein